MQKVPILQGFSCNLTSRRADFNRSFVLEPAGAPVDAAVLLHGLTDSGVLQAQRSIATKAPTHRHTSSGMKMKATEGAPSKPALIAHAT
jgi:hypothetical protein